METFEIDASQWLNVREPIRLQDLRGRVVVVGAFQLLCPACVAHSIPQLRTLHAMFADAPCTIIGLHTVFEHHAAMGLETLKAFMHENRVQFPVAVDRHDRAGDAVPSTMRTLALRGTPSMVVLDGAGRVVLNEFGHVDDLSLGVTIGQLLSHLHKRS